MLVALTALALAAPNSLSPNNGPELALTAELGALAPLHHTIQFGQQGSTIDYVKEGGQDNLFPFARLSAAGTFGERHTVTLLYQPLTLRSEAVFYDEERVDDVVFAAGTPVDLVYGFSFWRGSYTYDLAPDEDVTTGIGASLQLRNATISFTSADGSQRASYRNIGPVPVLRLHHRRPVGRRGFVAGEVDGFWAPIRYLNGGNSDVEGAIVDLSLRAGWELRHGAETFVNLRWLGGGAVGTSNNPTTGDGYNRNWLHFATLSLGVRVR